MSHMTHIVKMRIRRASGNIVPAAPTAGVVNDSANTFDFTYTPGYTSVSDYEYTLDGGATVFPLTSKPLSVGNQSFPAGQVGVRVKAAFGRDYSSWLFNATGFTVAGFSSLLSGIMSAAGIGNDSTVYNNGTL